MLSLAINEIKSNFGKLSNRLNIKLTKGDKKYSVYGGLY